MYNNFWRKLMNSIFEYNDLQIQDCSFRISPSSIGKFFDYPSVWYRDNILGEKEFTASTASVLGTVVHACAESYARKIEITREMIEEYITTAAKKQKVTDDAINLTEIRECYPDMAKTLINDYIRTNKPTEVEQQIFAPVLDDIYVGGSCDNRTGDTVVDYKTYNSKTKPSKIPFGYKIQLLAYCFCFKYAHDRILAQSEEDCKKEYLSKHNV